MKYDALHLVAGYRKANKRKKFWLRVNAGLAAVVVFCTTYALILPAITQERETLCGYAEHTHTDDCWQTPAPVLSCLPALHVHTDVCVDAEGDNLCAQADFVAHTHNPDCFGTENQLVCSFAEVVAHTHQEGCYTASDVDGVTETVLVCERPEVIVHQHDETCRTVTENLICEIPEVLGHVHTQDCFDAENNLTCPLLEAEAHTHQEGCYTTAEVDGITETVLSCELPEVVLHQHDETCWEIVESLTCTKTEVLEHVHTQNCFTTPETEPVLVCDRQEHQHAETCYIDKNADVETSAVWEATLPDSLTGEWTADVLAVAQGQLGYQESKTNVSVGEDGVIRGYTRYGAWHGDPYGDWSVMFTAFCLHYAGVKQDYFPYNADGQQWVTALTEAGLYIDAQGYIPTAGEPVFFRKGADGMVGYAGLVAEVVSDEDGTPARIKTIVGDADDRVLVIEYALTDAAILGYGNLSKAHEAFKKTEPQQKVYEDGAVTVTATYLPSAGIPEGAELVVKKIEPQTAGDYETCYQEALETLEEANGQTTSTTITDFQLYDISFLHLGEEIQPQDTVDIQICVPAAEMTETAEVAVVHYAKEGTQLPKLQESAVDEAGNLSASFETDSFSLFAVVTSETMTNYIVSMTQFDITANNIRSLGGNTYAIISGNYALTVDGQGQLAVKELLSQDSGVTGDESVMRWTFERSGSTGSNYYLSTTVNDTKYYLALTDSGLSLTENSAQGTVFAATRSGTNLTLGSGGDYINLSATGVGVGRSAALSLYTVPNGPFTVNFDGQLGYPQYWDSSNRKYTGAENVQVTTDAEGYVTLPTAEETKVPGNYPMRLNGWYDIINRVYYDSSMLGQRIKVTKDTIFYAEWVAETYDIGQNENVVTGQPDTRGFINTQVFDYNELFNVHSATYSESAGTWSLDPDSELGFIFFDYLTSGNIANMNNKDVAIDGITVNVEKTNGTRGSSTNFPGTITPGIATDARINALFGDTPIPGRLALGEADWLYSFDEETGYYYYNSAKNAASYNQSEQRFYVYDYVVNIDSQNSLNDFLPFNYGQTEYAEKDNEANYWFGMKSEINFYLPEDSGSGLNTAANGVDDMQFRFSGDDDVWIFIDGELALDLGGVHDVVYGEINFSTGQVKTGQALSSSAVADNTAEGYDGMPGVSGTVGVTTSDLPMPLAGGQEHTLTIYYLERGSSLSNCAIYFNLSSAYELEIAKRDAQGANLLTGATFQVFDDEACTQPSTLYWQRSDGTLEAIPDSRFTIGDPGIATCWGLLFGRTYYIKEVESPPGYPDMSDHTIQVHVSNEGTTSVLITDNTGEQWIYADTRIDSDDPEHLRIKLDVYNDKHTGGDKQLYVEKVWAEGSENIPDEITVQLYADGQITSRSLVLRAENDWKGVFYHLPQTDDDGNEIVYTVKEKDVPGGYAVTYEETEGRLSTQVEVPAHWETVTTLENGATYRFVSASTGWAVQGANSSSVNPALVSDTDDAQLWVAVASGNGFLLQNKAYPTRYLSIGTSTNGISTTTSTRGNNVVITLEDGKLGSSGGGYLRDGTKTTINGSGYGYRGTRSSSSAGTFAAYQWVEASVEEGETEPIPGWRVTNTPGPETISIPVEKQWDDTVSQADRNEVTVNLYLVTEQAEPSVEIKGTLTLNAENEWTGRFDGLPPPPDGSYYCILEDTDQYAVSYSGETVSIFVDNQTQEAARVEMDEGGQPVTINIINSALILLPNTGGSGIQMYVLGGGLLITLAGILLLYIHLVRKIKNGQKERT